MHLKAPPLTMDSSVPYFCFSVEKLPSLSATGLNSDPGSLASIEAVHLVIQASNREKAEVQCGLPVG